MIGFKSFANKTTIEFDSGFTAIVGPNGSGKSNITEAIKWVLGEQSAKSLRGRKMDDVIFGGASNRSKAQYAEVTLVFDNSDHLLNIDTDEVSMTRRYTRAGESTYMINRKNCRLKDMTELMMDTGIGRDSFSIISQGQVEAIFMQKPEDRRAIFEEAAGVMKYKNRKKEASNKLEHTQENLDRIFDILKEVESRLEPLAKQRHAALNYQEKRAELSDIEIALTTVQIETLNEQWENAKNDLNQYVQTIQQQKEKQTEFTEQLNAIRQQEHTAEQKATELNETYIQLVREAETIKRQIDLAEQQKAFNQRDKAAQEKTLADYQSSIDQLTRDVGMLKADVHDAQLAFEQKKVQRDDKLQALAALDTTDEHDIEEKREEYIAAIQQQSQLQHTIAELEKDIEQLRQQSQQDVQSQDDFQQSVTELETTLATKKADKDNLSTSLSDLLADYKQLAQSVKDKQQTAQQLNRQWQQQQRQLVDAKTRQESLENLAKEHNGFYYGVRSALKLQSQMNGIHGAVADLMQVPSEYVGAVETALGGAMQNIVTSNRQVAAQVIQTLKKNRGGRATFLPMDVIKPREIPNGTYQIAQAMPGFIGVMVDLIDFDDQYQSIMANLMGQTLVVDNLSHAQDVAQAIHHRSRIVTLESDVIHAGGSMSGGARNQKGDSVLARKRDIETLKASIATLTKKTQTTNQQVEHLQTEIDEATQKLETMKTTGDEKRFQERTLIAEIEQLTKQLDELTLQEEQNNQHRQDMADKLQEMESQLEEKREAIVTQGERVDSLQQTIQALNLSANEKASHRDQLQHDIQTIETDYAVSKEKLAQQNNQLNHKEQQLTEQKDTLVELQKAVQSMSSQLDNHSEETAELEANYKDLLEEQKTTEKALKQSRSQREVAKQQADKMNKTLDDLTTHLEDLYYKQAKLEGTVSRYEVSIDNHLDHLREEYGLTFEKARAESELTMSIEAASERVRDLKREIDQLGPVNIAAIDEYDDVHQRWTFMTEQRDDVMAAKDNLLQTMDALDKEVIHRFKETFLAVREAFERIFPQLFGGGKASLSLTDPDDLLHSGVDIMAQPPGKRLQQLSLLSGGEKALTAIALLFAILDVKKDIPFSILDEVEAALDEANVARYGRYLREFAESTQFIVITHRKGTMEAANILYGVTMQQSGVSKLASVRLEDIEEVDDMVIS